jgi:signal transduction histidine kinase
MVLLVMAIGVFIVLYQRKRNDEFLSRIKRDQEYAEGMIQAQLESQERERQRMAADLHDSIGSLLWGAKLNASFLGRSNAYDKAQQESHLELMTALDQSLETVRRIAWELTPEAFQQAGFSASIQKLCSRLSKTTLVFTIEENEAFLWNDDRALSAFRIVQELVSNAIKHAHASAIHIALLYQTNSLQIKVSDNGTGFELDAQRTGVGWWNIQQRVRKLNGTITINRPLAGSEIILKVSLLP